MAKATLDSIQQTEEQAKSTLDQAWQNAAALLEQQKQKESEAFQSLQQTMKRKAELNLAVAQQEAEQDTLLQQRETDDLCNELQAKLALKKSAAVDSVMHLILKEASSAG